EGTAPWHKGVSEEAPAQLRGTDDTTPGRCETVRRRARRTGRRGEEDDGPSSCTGPGHDEERRGVGRQGPGCARKEREPRQDSQERHRRQGDEAPARRPVGRELRG